MTYDDVWLKLKNAVFAALIYATLLLIAMFITGILSQNFSSNEAGRVGITFLILLISSCFFARKFNDKKFIRFLKLLLPAIIFYLIWNIVAELTMWKFLGNDWSYWRIIPALVVSWSAKLLTWIMPYLLYRNMKKDETHNIVKPHFIIILSTTILLIAISVHFIKQKNHSFDRTKDSRRVPISEIADKYFPENK